MNVRLPLFAIAVAISFLAISTPSTTAETLTFQLLYQKNGAAADDHFAPSVAGAGDVNGDGRADFIIGAPNADPGGDTSAGSAFIYSGTTGALLYQKNGSAAGDYFGTSLSGAGDVNKDGIADFIIGAPGAGVFNAGSAYVFSGADGSLLFQKNGAATAYGFGQSVAGVGDVNIDGRADFIVGAYAARPGGFVEAGSAYIYSGADGSLLYQKNGDSSGDWLGISVAGAGDINDDGNADFIVGADFTDPDELTDAGSSFVYSGADGSLLYRINGGSSGDFLGWSVSGAGDVNGDGKADFIIGAPTADPGGLAYAGSAFIYSGADGSLLYQKNGFAYSHLGWSVAGAGDVNGDGKAEFIVGAVGPNLRGLSSAGLALIYSGADGSLLYQINGDSAVDQLGYSVAGASDINGDGRADIIVGAPTASRGGLAYVGYAYIYGLVPTDAPEEKENHPIQFGLSQNYPNPFNPTTTIRYFLPKREKVTLEIFNLVGQRVKVAVNAEQSAGEHTFEWKGTDEKGKILPSGIYFYKLTAKDFTETKKMIFLK